MPLTIAELQASLGADATKLNAALAKAGADINTFASTNSRQLDTVSQAFATLGIKSEASMAAAAAKAQAAFQVISTSGTASASDVARAQAAMQTAMAASTGEVTRAIPATQLLRAESFALGGEMGRLTRVAAVLGSGMGVGSVAMIGLGFAAAALIPKLVSLFGEHGKLIEVNTKAVDIEALHTATMQRLAAAAAGMASPMDAAAAAIAHIGTSGNEGGVKVMSDAINTLASNMAIAKDKGDALDKANDVLNTTLGMLNQSTTQVVAGTGDLGEGFGSLRVNTDSLREDTGKARTEFDKATVTVEHTVDAIKHIADQYGLTSAQTMQLAANSRQADEVIAKLALTFEGVAGATRDWARALEEVRIPGLKLDATTEGIAKQTAALTKVVQDQTKAGQSQVDITIAAKPALDKLAESVKIHTAATIAQTGTIKNSAEGHKEWKAAIDAIPAPLQAAAQAAFRTDENLKKMTLSVGGHARATKDALQGILGSVNDFLSAMNEKARVSDTIWKQFLVPSGSAAALKAQSDRFHAAMDEKQALEIKDFAATQHWVDTSAEEYLKLSAAGSKLMDMYLVTLPTVTHNFSDFALVSGISFKAASESARLFGLAWVQALSPTGTAFVTFGDQIQRMIGNLNNLGNTSAFVQQLGAAFKAAGEEGGKSAEVINAGWADLVVKLKAQFPDLAAEIQKTADKMGSLVDVWDTVRTKLEHINNQIGAGMKSLLQGIQQSMGLAATTFVRDVNDITAVVATIPGAFGNAVRQVNQTVEQWLNFANAILKILHDMVSSKIPASLGDLVTTMKGGVTKATQTATDAITSGMASADAAMHDALHTMGSDIDGGWGAINDTVATQTGQVVTQVQSMASKAITAVGGMMAGIAMVMTGHAQGGTMGMITGALGGFMTGATIGSLIAPGIGTIIGGVIGAIGGLLGGLFGGGKSIQQTEADKQAVLQTQQMQQSLQKGAQDIIQAAMKTFQDALATLDKLADFTKVPKATIRAFFQNLGMLLNDFATMAQQFSGSLMDQAKKFADSMGPVVTMIGEGVTSLAALGGFTPIAQTDIDSFMTALTAVWNGFETFVAGMEIKTVKLARRFANNISDVITMVGNGVAAFTALATFQAPAADAITQFTATLDMIVKAVQAMANAADNFLLKGAQRFSQKVNDVVTMIGGALTAFVGLSTWKGPLAGSIDEFVATLQALVGRIIEVSTTFDAHAVAGASTFGKQTVDILNGIKAGVDAFANLGNVGAIAPAAIASLATGIKLAAAAMIDVSANFDPKLVAAASDFSKSASVILTLVKDAAGAFTALLGYASAPQQVIDILFQQMKYAMAGMVGLAQAVEGPMFDDAAIFAAKTGAIFIALKAGVDTFNALRNFEGVPAYIIQAFSDSFAVSVQLLDSLLDKALQMKDKAAAFADAMISTASSIKTGVSALAGSISTLTTAVGSAPGGASTIRVAGGAAPAPAAVYQTITVTIDGRTITTLSQVQQLIASFAALRQTARAF